LWSSEWGTEELFNLDADPDEMHNLAPLPDHAELLSLWKGRLVQDLTGREEGFVRDGQLVTGAKVVGILSHTRELLDAKA
jgi:arylsulfatase